MEKDFLADLADLLYEKIGECPHDKVDKMVDIFDEFARIGLSIKKIGMIVNDPSCRISQARTPELRRERERERDRTHSPERPKRKQQNHGASESAPNEQKIARSTQLDWVPEPIINSENGTIEAMKGEMEPVPFIPDPPDKIDTIPTFPVILSNQPALYKGAHLYFDPACRPGSEGNLIGVLDDIKIFRYKTCKDCTDTTLSCNKCVLKKTGVGATVFLNLFDQATQIPINVSDRALHDCFNVEESLLRVYTKHDMKLLRNRILEAYRGRILVIRMRFPGRTSDTQDLWALKVTPGDEFMLREVFP